MGSWPLPSSTASPVSVAAAGASDAGSGNLVFKRRVQGCPSYVRTMSCTAKLEPRQKQKAQKERAIGHQVTIFWGIQKSLPCRSTWLGFAKCVQDRSYKLIESLIGRVAQSLTRLSWGPPTPNKLSPAPSSSWLTASMQPRDRNLKLEVMVERIMEILRPAPLNIRSDEK